MVGSEAQIICPACATTNLVGARFCRNCGARIAGNKPSNVTRFEQLMYLSLGIGVVYFALRYPMFLRDADAAFRLIVTPAFVFGITILLIWLIARRRANWARWVLLIAFLPGWVASNVYLIGTFHMHGFEWNYQTEFLSIAQLFIEGIGVYLIFTGNVVAWFRKPPS